MGFRHRVTDGRGKRKEPQQFGPLPGGILKFCSSRHLIKLSRTPRSKGGAGSRVSFCRSIVPRTTECSSREIHPEGFVSDKAKPWKDRSNGPQSRDSIISASVQPHWRAGRYIEMETFVF